MTGVRDGRDAFAPTCDERAEKLRIGGECVVIGRDVRLSSLSALQAMVSGSVDCGNVAPTSLSALCNHSRCVPSRAITY